MKTRRLLLLIAILCLVINTISFGLDINIPSPNLDFYVYDGAEIISRELEEYIISTNEKINKETGSQLVVISLSSLDNIDITQYAREIFDRWKIGKEGLDNGILVLIAPNEDRVWIEVGYGLEGAIPDSIGKRIIEDKMIPYFKVGDFENGVLSGFNSLIQLVEEEYNISVDNLREVDRTEVEKDRSFSYLNIIIIIIILLADIKFFNGAIISTVLRVISIGGLGGTSSRDSGNHNNKGGGGRSGGGGAGGSW